MSQINPYCVERQFFFLPHLICDYFGVVLRRFTLSWSTRSLARGKQLVSPELWKSDETDFCGQESLSGWRCDDVKFVSNRWFCYLIRFRFKTTYRYCLVLWDSRLGFVWLRKGQGWHKNDNWRFGLFPDCYSFLVTRHYFFSFSLWTLITLPDHHPFFCSCVHRLLTSSTNACIAVRCTGEE